MLNERESAGPPAGEPADSGPLSASASSTVRRDKRGSATVYVKEYRMQPPFRPEVIVRRTAREIDLLGRLAHARFPPRRLGRLAVLESNAAAGRVVYAEAPGQPLQELLVAQSPGRRRFALTRALYLAGKWLSAFQELPVHPGDERRATQDPDGFLDYAMLRLRKLEAAAVWPDAAWRGRIVRAIEALLAAVPPSDAGPVWVHGDYGPGNILWDGHTLTPIDFSMCVASSPFADAAYFVHRLEMLAAQLPWRRYPLPVWTGAFLRGFGRSGARSSPGFALESLRCLLCRLASVSLGSEQSFARRLQRRWVLRRVRRGIVRIVEDALCRK